MRKNHVRFLLTATNSNSMLTDSHVFRHTFSLSWKRKQEEYFNLFHSRWGQTIFNFFFLVITHLARETIFRWTGGRKNSKQNSFWNEHTSQKLITASFSGGDKQARHVIQLRYRSEDLLSSFLQFEMFMFEFLKAAKITRNAGACKRRFNKRKKERIW